LFPGGSFGMGLQNALLGDGLSYFHTSLYPSEKVLDFIVAFYNGPPGVQESTA